MQAGLGGRQDSSQKGKDDRRASLILSKLLNTKYTVNDIHLPNKTSQNCVVTINSQSAIPSVSGNKFSTNFIHLSVD